MARDALCSRLALIGVAHVFGVGQRVLICGPSGAGKSHAAMALADALGQPFFYQEMDQITSTGFKGLDLVDFLYAAAQRNSGTLDGAVIFFDELDKCRIGEGADGNSLEARLSIQHALLGLLDRKPVSPDASGARQIATDKTLIIGAGSFGGRFVHSPPTTPQLVRYGFTIEFAARWTERICLPPLGYAETLELLTRSDRSVPKSLGPLMDAVGIQVVVPPAVIAYVADFLRSAQADFRTASEWILEAARQRLLDALERDIRGEIMLTPDDIHLPDRRDQPRNRR